MNDAVLRAELIKLLQEGQAHTSVKKALANVNPEIRGRRPTESVHSIWENLEHIRIAQEDILRYTLDAGWLSPVWPEGYWPADGVEITDAMWNASVEKFFADLDEVIALVENSALDLTAEIPHGQSHTYLREVLLIADHNAYHLGQIVLVRKLLGDWA